MTNIEVLNAMKNELMTRGWCQGTFKDNEDKLCLLGSYTRSNSIPRDTSHIDWLVRALQNVIGCDDGVISFNDTPGRTFNDIIDVLDQAIYNEKEKESF